KGSSPASLWRGYALSPGSYSTTGADTAAVYSNATTLRNAGVYIAPYTQQHTLIAPSTTAPNDTATVLGFLQQELASPDDGYTSMPTRGATDYWLASFDYNLKNNIADALYIDEAYYPSNVSASLISGSGFTDSTLVNRNGYNSLGLRTYLKRLRQL